MAPDHIQMRHFTWKPFIIPRDQDEKTIKIILSQQGSTNSDDDQDGKICTRQQLQLARLPEQCLVPPPLKMRFEVWLYQLEADFWQV